MIITPMYNGAGSGAGAYYRLLVHTLRQNGYDVTVVSDRERRKGDKRHIRLFPTWTSKKKGIGAYLKYGLQNLSYFALPAIISAIRPNVVLFHTAFLNLPGVFPVLLRACIHLNRTTRFVADVRDRGLRSTSARLLNGLEGVIACSENVLEFLTCMGISRSRIVHIPIPQGRLDVEQTRIDEVLREYCLDGQKYVLFTGRIKREKRIDLLLEAFLSHVLPSHQDVKLVLAGPLKTSSKEILEGMQSQSVIYAGNLEHDRVLALVAGCALCVNLCPTEGLPRSCLEAIALRRPVLLPPNIPEFERHCPEFVVRSTLPAEVGHRINCQLDAGNIAEYPVENHGPDTIIAKYEDVLWPLR